MPHLTRSFLKTVVRQARTNYCRTTEYNHHPHHFYVQSIYRYYLQQRFTGLHYNKMTALTSVVILISRLECIGVHFAKVLVLVSRPQCQSLYLHLAAMVSVFQGAAVFFKMSTRNETKYSAQPYDVTVICNVASLFQSSHSGSSS